jgi:hypothetical protein
LYRHALLSKICVETAILLCRGCGGRQTGHAPCFFWERFHLIFDKLPQLHAGTLDLPPGRGRLAQESKMEMFRNIEVVLVLCFGLLCAAALVAPRHAPQQPDQAQGNPATQIPVVVITGKRLSAAEKARASHQEG